MFDRLSVVRFTSSCPSPGPIRRMLGVLLLALAFVGLSASPAMAQASGRQALEFIDQINRQFGPRGGVESADAVLFPAIASMDRKPGSLANLEIASLIVPGNRGWDSAERWATAPAQQAVLEAVKTITDVDRRFQFTHPYTHEGVPEEFVEAGLAVDISPVNLLVTARYDYLDRLDDVAILLSVEATRLAEVGEAEASLDVLYAWLRLGRIVADRGMSLEKYWGFGTMLVAMERMRDVVYLYDYNFDINVIAKHLQRIRPTDLRIDLIQLPEGDRLAAKQLVARTMAARGAVVVPQFSATMGFVEADGRELTVLDKAAFYRTIAQGHAGYQRSNEKIDDLFGGWQARWQITNPHDDLLTLPSDFMLMDRREFYALMVVLSDIEWLYSLRLVTVQELFGTQTALGLAGYRARHREWPRNIAAISPNPLPRPRGLVPAWADLFNWNRPFERFEDMRYFVPIRDTPAPASGDAEPHEITVIGGSLFELFSRGRPDDIGLAAAQLGSVSRIGVIDMSGAAVSSTALGSGMPSMGAMGGMGMFGMDPGMIPGFDAIDLADIDIPDDLFDVENLKINADSLRRFLIDITEATPVTQGDREEFVQMIRGVQEEYGFDPRNAETEAPRAVRRALTEEPLKTLLTSSGVEIPRLSRALEGMVGAMVSGPKMKEAINSAMGNSSVSAELLKEASLEATNNMIQAQYIDPLVETIIRAMAQQMGGRDEVRNVLRQMVASFEMMSQSGIDQITGTTLERFTTRVTQAQFVLYSIGANGVNGQARQVGLGGTDILYWPPLLSLKRDHLERAGGGL